MKNNIIGVQAPTCVGSGKDACPYVRVRMRKKMAHGHLSRSVSLCADACAEGNCPHSDRSM